MTSSTPVGGHRLERILAVLVAVAVGVSIVSFLAVIIGTAAGERDFGGGLWPTVIMTPLLGLPLGFLLLVTLLIVSAVRRGRETKDASR